MNANRGIPVVLDTNFLLLPFQHRVDIFREIERLLEEPHYFVIVKQTLDELKELAKRQRTDSPAARAALALAEKKEFLVEGSLKGDADKAIVQFCSTHSGAVVCTKDKKLQDKVRAVGARVISSRDKGYLGIR